MPVGKNALKRVSNNGYSKVNTSAPDMEHSVVADPVAEPAPEADSHPDGFVRYGLGAELPVHLL